ncbi:TlpA family protein disulfide reductase [Jejuia pallidilutea]|jgi:thiol-disulfide isomerase/thioredoxin|uniref:Thioredoxin family protein n=2 Tax=Jejuia pallidilutea TaxID=504487 RepID=A0A090W071_9FLAO|nr:TlpA disulfide reductase family protein [Jejuia pallidilutea]GAL68884.1 thioredoxin family protein [Jejuia pallidilutea]GAL72918.1 thioredoxin family protein [Jejuia pallidilutea]GAL91014.1 thioredoxin family protein [Jejuia pallidilutea]
MKKVMYLLVILISSLSCNIEKPTQFSEAALNDTLLNLEGNEVSLQYILEKHKGKTIVIDIWASWCGDCIKGMPKVRALQKQYPETVFLFFSLDRGADAWKRGIEKYEVVGEHYFLPKGKKSAFGDFVDISWIPRYMLINKAGEIVVFNVIKADDDKLTKALKK